MSEIDVLPADLIERCFTASSQHEDLVVNPTSLQLFWNEAVSLDAPAGFQLFKEAFLVISGIDSAELHARSGGWKLHLTRGAVRSAVLGPLVAALLYAAGVQTITPAILSLVLPMLFDIERVRLSRRHEEILIHLIRQAGVERARTAEEMYGLLPERLREDVNRLDFLDFVEVLKLTGHATRQGEKRVILSSPENPRIRVQIE